MSDFFIYELDGRTTIWEGAALILNIDPADILERPRKLSDNPTYGIGEILTNENADYYLYPDKEDYIYQKTMNALIQKSSEPASDFDVENLCYEFVEPRDFDQFTPQGFSSKTVCQTSTIDVFALKKWAVSKGFKSDFLGNLEPEENEQAEKSSSFNKQAQRELVLKCWLKFYDVDTSQAMNKTKQEIWNELHKLDKHLFSGNTGLEDFFKNQKFVNFPNGKNKKLIPFD